MKGISLGWIVVYPGSYSVIFADEESARAYSRHNNEPPGRVTEIFEVEQR